MTGNFKSTLTTPDADSASESLLVVLLLCIFNLNISVFSISDVSLCRVFAEILDLNPVLCKGYHIMWFCSSADGSETTENHRLHLKCH